MIIILLIILILVALLPWNKNTIFSLALSRVSSIAIIFSSFLAMNILFLDRLSSGVSIYSGFFSASSINQTFLILLLLTGGIILAVLSSNRYLSFNQNTIIYAPSHPYFNNYGVVILFNLVGASLLITVNDILSFYIAIETQSFSLYLLSALKNDSVNSAKAGLKYFLIGSLASTIILLGLALLYYATGLTNFDSLATYLNITDFFSAGAYGGGIVNHSPYFNEMHFWNFADFNPYSTVIFLSFTLILSGLFIKVGAAPFHQWAPDVYSLVPTAVTTWLVILPKISIFILIFQLLELILNTGNANSFGNLATEVYNFFENEGLNLTFQNYPNFLSHLEDIATFNFLNKLFELYNEATFFYPHYAQLELTNLYNSPISSENSFSKYENSVSSVWNNFNSFYNNSLTYTINIATLGSISIKNFLILISIFSLIIGSIGGLVQTQIKRLLAFSSINNLGFIILALAINNKVGLESFLFYLTQYTITNLNIFFIIIGFGYMAYSLPFNMNNSKTGKIYTSYQENSTLVSDINFINQLKGLLMSNPILTLSLIVSLFSFVGVPPLVGFFAKQQVLLSAISLGLIFIAIIAINTSVVSAVYYLALIKNTLLKEIVLFNNTNNNSQSYKSVEEHGKELLFSSNLNKNFNQAQNNSNLTKEVLTVESAVNNNINLQIQPINNNFNLKFSFFHSYTISLLTLSILFFMLKANICFNIFSLLTSFLFIL